MTQPITLVFLLAGAFFFSGCAQQLPLTSHAHMGHSLTAWHDTPDNQALLEVAEKELAVAIMQADAAMKTPLRAEIKEHFSHILNALNPDQQPRGPGLQYGAIRALQGTLEHLEYAAASPDASSNLLGSMVDLISTGETVLTHLRKAQEIVLASLDDRSVDVSTATVAVQNELKKAAFGDDNISDQTDGMRGLHDAMQAMLDRESDPHYEPLPRRYVLGLVRLPNGKWGYRLAKSASYGGY